MSTHTLFVVSYFALWTIVAFQTVVLLELVRRSASASPDEMANSATSGLAAGTPAPTFAAALIDGDRSRPKDQAPIMDFSELVGTPTLLSFISPRCPTCVEALDTIRHMAARSDARLCFVCDGGWGDCVEFRRRHLYGHEILVSDATSTITSDYRALSPPVTVLVDEGWRVAKYGRPGEAVDPPADVHDHAETSMDAADQRRR